VVAHQSVLSLFSYDRLSKKPLLFKSFTGLTVLEFDDIYDKEMTKKYHKHENKRLSKRKDSESNLLVQVEGISNWMLKKISNASSVLSPFYITYTLAGFFCLSSIRATYAEIYKR
jgi:hypothetical protein